jgi:tetratricopeptide (TPR) repeat protein
MAQVVNHPPKLGDLLAGFLGRQAEAQAAGIAGFDGEVTPYEVGPVQPLDPKLAWDEALAVLTLCGAGTPQKRKAPPHWSQLVAGHESIVAIALSAGNFPQLIRNFHTILTQPDLTTMRPNGGQPPAQADLASWAESIANTQAFPDMLLVLGAFRLARQFDAADEFIAAHDAAVPAEWRNAWENEKAALAWHSGRCAEARQQWQTLEPTAPVLFNRGMAALFAGDYDTARQDLTAAVAQLPASSAWHHLGRLYLTLTQLRKA